MDVKAFNDRGLFYTVAAILLILPLILLISFHLALGATESDDRIEKMRCDELHYFIEDVNEDLRRAVVIFGRRAAVYSINEVIKSGETLRDYSFNCTGMCGVDCSVFGQSLHGAEAAIAELSICGTLMGEPVPYMVNHTLREWIGRFEAEGELANFNTSIVINDLKVVPKDAWTFSIHTNATFRVYDKYGACYFEGEPRVIRSDTSILGLEDPLYTLNTRGREVKYINNCTFNLDLEDVAGCSLENQGNGTASGTPLFMSQVPVRNRPTFCEDHADEVKDLILIVDYASGAAPCAAGQFDQHCFNISSPYQFGGVINYYSNRMTPFIEHCDVTIPWVIATAKIDNVTKHGPGWGRAEGCDDGIVGEGQCIAIYNHEECGLHQVLLGYSSDSLDTSCYPASNASLYGGADGPSFFDRLEGNYNLTQYYVNQSLLYYNNPRIGLESLVSPHRLERRGLHPNIEASWVDYYYWQNISGCDAVGYCITGVYALKLDDVHADAFEVDTECFQGRQCGATTTTHTMPTTTTTSTSSTSTTTTTIAPPCTGFSDGMESGEGSWTHGGAGDDWEVGTPKWGGANSGKNCWATDLSGNYLKDSDRWLMSEEIHLGGTINPTLTFYHKHRFRSETLLEDTGYVEVSRNGGISWIKFASYTGNQKTWMQETISLSGYAGQTIQIRFRLYSYDWLWGGTDLGWYIDDVQVSC